MRRALVVALLLPFTALACTASVSTSSSTESPPSPQVPEPGPLEGVWRILSEQTTTAAGETTDTTIQASVVIFTEGYYSIAYSTGDEPFPLYEQRWSPTDEEQLSRMIATIVNTGTYEVDGSRVVTRPIFARVPEFEGGSSEYEWSISGDTLTLTQVGLVSVDGVEQPLIAAGNRTVYTLTRLE